MNNLSNVQKRVLSFLSETKSEHYYLREIARFLEVDAGNLSREISDLVDKNLVVKFVEGKKVYFKISKSGFVGKPKFTISNNDLNKKLAEIKPRLTELVKDLIRIPSVSGENPEREIADFIKKYCRSIGIKIQEVAKDNLRPNLILDTDPEKYENFLFLGHMDTISAGDIRQWEHFPFSGHNNGGRIVGRGSIDMKGGIACEIYTLWLIKELGLNLPFNVRVALVSNEEGGSADTPIFEQGMQHLVESGFIRGKAAIYGYGGSFNVGIGHRGVLRVRIKTEGERVHTGSLKWQNKEKGINAVTGMAELLLELEKMELPIVSHPDFPKHSNVITPGTMILHGGSAVSTVPDECTTVVEVRYLPGTDIKAIYSQIRELCERVIKNRSGLKVFLEKFVDIPAVILPKSEPVVEILSEACKEEFDQVVSTRGYGPANESFMLIKKGIPTVVFGPLGGGAHAPNEYVYEDSLVKTIRVYLKVLEKFARRSGL